MSKVKITAVEGNKQLLDGGAMFGNAPREMWKKWLSPDELNRIPLSCRSFLIQKDRKNILLETGIGTFFDPKLKDRYGVQEDEHMLLKNLEKLGINESKIDCVILSHLHFDHAGGLMPSFNSQRKELHFPNAKYVVSRVAFERNKNPHFRDRASYIPDLPERLLDSGRLILVDSQTHKDVYDDFISFRFSEGHTPGQMHTVVKTPQNNYLFAGDLVPGCAWVHLPITMGYDRFAEKVIDEKQEMYEQLDLNKLILMFTHDPDYVACSVRINEKKKYEAFQPMKKFDQG